MALMKCPECEGTVSDQAQACPHCGFPLRPAVSEFRAWRKRVLMASVVLCGIGLVWGIAALSGGHNQQAAAIYVLALSLLGIVLAGAKLFFMSQTDEQARQEFDRLRGESQRR